MSKVIKLMISNYQNAINDSEETILIKSLKHVILPKLNSKETLIFEEILSVIFNETEILIEQEIEPNLRSAVEQCLAEMNLQILPSQIHKINHLHSVIKNYAGIMIVGGTMAGKTSILKVLLNVYTKLNNLGLNQNYKEVKLFVLNPESLTSGELYGDFDKNSEWIDGLLGPILTKSLNEREFDSWILFDGTFEPTCLDNLNSLLDDSRTVCLSNSEQVKPSESTKIIFEIGDCVENASPATISRCGIVYIEEHEISWTQIVDSWLRETKILEDLKEYIKSLYDQYIEEFLKNADSFMEIYRQPDVAKIKVHCSLMSYFLTDVSTSSSKIEESQTYVCKLWIWCLLWAMGSNFCEDSKVLLESQMRTLFQQNEKANLPVDGSLWE